MLRSCLRCVVLLGTSHALRGYRCHVPFFFCDSRVFPDTTAHRSGSTVGLGVYVYASGLLLFVAGVFQGSAQAILCQSVSMLLHVNDDTERTHLGELVQDGLERVVVHLVGK